MNTVIRRAAVAALVLVSACGAKAPPPGPSPDFEAAVAPGPAAYWNNATIYFLLTDRFYNGDPDNDLALGRARDGGLLRNFQGGDLAGVLEKLEEGYFEALGVDAIWMTPFQEQIHGSTDEGTGRTYAYHGYWTRDWTAVDPALGTGDDLRAVVEAAHARGIPVTAHATNLPSVRAAVAEGSGHPLQNSQVLEGTLRAADHGVSGDSTHGSVASLSHGI